jgi:hypothetical protein
MRSPISSRLRVAAAIAVAIVLLDQPIGHAQDHSTIIRVLRESRDFRARSRAAMALGSSADPAAVGPLVGALSDSEPAVRVAAATGLGRLGNPDALSPLRRSLTDSSREVHDAAQAAIRQIESIAGARPPEVATPRTEVQPPPRMPLVEVLPPQRDVDWDRVHYVVVLGPMMNRSGFEHDRLGTILEREVQRHLVVLRGVATIPDGGASAETDREITRRHLPRMRLEGSITNVHRAEHGHDLHVRCEVSLMLLDEPGHNLRAALNGAATGQERASSSRTTQEIHLAERALEGAVESAMSGAARAITGAR